MRFKLLSGALLGSVVWLAGLAFGGQSANVASADGPVGGVDPISGSLFQTFTFGFEGFQPNAVLTLSLLMPGTTTFATVDTASPVVTDAKGQALVRLGLPALLGYPSVTSAETAGPELAQLASQVRVIRGPPRNNTSIERFRFDVCDTQNCVDLVGGLVPLSGP